MASRNLHTVLGQVGEMLSPEFDKALGEYKKKKKLQNRLQERSESALERRIALYKSYQHTSSK